MVRVVRFSMAAALLLGAALGLGAQSPAKPGKTDPAAAELVRAFEAKLDLAGLDVTNDFTLVQKKEGEADRVLRVRVYRRDAAETFTLVFQYPDSERGKGYWRSGADLYLYLPSTREFVYRNRKDDVGSTDIRTDLFGRPDALGQFWATMAGTAKVASWECDVVRLDAKKLDVSYPVQKWYLRRGDGLPVKVENFSAGETLLRTVYYVEYKEVAKGKFIFAKLLSTDALEKGRRTLLSNEGITTARIADYKFSKAFLEEQSR
ncbi:MAG TPA: outer membrane lipoprotein-sorting protein [Spirochaetales bacterium]|nr:outer membrane lipoprotein-sorting protein [Spirochaetales bacterium]